MKAFTVIIAGATTLLAGLIAVEGGGTENLGVSAASVMPAVPDATPKDTVAELEKRWGEGNDLCRGSYEQREAKQGCAKRAAADAKLKRLGWCFEYSDWRVFPVDYAWHRCSIPRPANFRPDPAFDPKPAPAPIATAAAYDALRYGMPLPTVEKIIGFAGNEKVASYVAGYETKMVTRQNPDGGSLTVEFQNGVLIMKSQYGLR